MQGKEKPKRFAELKKKEKEKVCISPKCKENETRSLPNFKGKLIYKKYLTIVVKNEKRNVYFAKC